MRTRFDCAARKRLSGDDFYKNETAFRDYSALVVKDKIAPRCGWVFSAF